MELNIEKPLENRIEEFRSDPEKMKDVNDFLSEVLEKAKTEAEHRTSKQHKIGSLGLQSESWIHHYFIRKISRLFMCNFQYKKTDSIFNRLI